MQIVKNVCDRHRQADGDSEVEATQVGVLIKLNRREGESDLCAECFNELNEMLDAWFAIGRRPGKPATPVTSSATAKVTPRAVAPGDSTATGTSGAHSKRAQEADPDGQFHCRWPEGCEKTYPGAQGRSMHERKAHDFFFNDLPEEEQKKATQALHDRLFSAA